MQGDIVFVQFPFSNLSEKKWRPALVLSNDRYNRHLNVMLAGIYSKEKPMSVLITRRDVQRKRLLKTSYVSLQNIFSIEKALVRHTIDALAKSKLTEVLAEAARCF